MAPGDSEFQRFGDLAPSEYPGERLGLPESGSRSVGRVGRRLSALLVDWLLATVVSILFFHYDPWATLLSFACLQIIFIPTIGGSIGHLALGLRVAPLGQRWVGVWRPIVRTVLLCLVVPALIWDSDQRGFHDKVAGTVLIRA